MNLKFHCSIVLAIAAVIVGCGSATELEANDDDTADNGATVRADVWADNWFALYREDELIKEDSVPFNTERSFNSESFQFETALPVQMSVVIKDFYENDSGLEYIGSRRQQMGDGGFMAQFFDAASGDLLQVSNGDWRCRVIHRAPLNPACERTDNPEESCQSEINAEPDNWRDNDFDASSWANAVVHSARDVRPHGGYTSVDWESSAQLIWGEDLEKDNVLLCRFTIPAP